MSLTPLPTTGITGGISETGIATIEVPVFVATLADALTVLPDLGVQLPYRSRNFSQEEDGTFKVVLHFEGITSSPSEDQVTFELDASMNEDPIQTHPYFDTLKTRYHWDAVKEQFSETLPENSGQQTALSGGNSQKTVKNPLFGVENWLVVGAVFRKTYSAVTIPGTLLRGIGTIIDRPPGIEQFRIPSAASKRNWLKMAPKIKRKGNAVEITEEYMLSGPNGWIKDIYGQAQLEGGG